MDLNDLLMALKTATDAIGFGLGSRAEHIVG
jgi:hypothetical protein